MWSACTEAMLTIEPDLRASIDGSITLAQSQADLRSTEKTSSHSDSVMVTGSALELRPAL